MTNFFKGIDCFLIFAKHQRRTTFLIFSLVILLFVSVISLFFIYDEYTLQRSTYLLKNKEYLKIQESRLNTLTSTYKEQESIVSFFKKKQFDKPVKNSQMQKTIDKIKRQLRLENCKISSGSDTLVDKSLNIYSKKMTFDIQSNTDQKFYQLIDRLHHQMPGIIVIKKFSVQKSPPVKTGNYLFQGTIECLWIRQKHD